MDAAQWIKQACQYLGGEQDEPPAGFPIAQRSVWWGLWWGLLACAIFVFCGQSSKFIYIDF